MFKKVIFIISAFCVVFVTCSSVLHGAHKENQNQILSYVDIGVRPIFGKLNEEFDIDVSGKYLILRSPPHSTILQKIEDCGSKIYLCFHVPGTWFVFSWPADDINLKENRGEWAVGGYHFRYEKFESSIISDLLFKVWARNGDILIASYIVGSSGELFIYTTYSPITFGCKNYSKEFEDERRVKELCDTGAIVRDYISTNFISETVPWSPKNLHSR